MPNPEQLKKIIFNINDEDSFNETSLEIFRFQYFNNKVYRDYADALNRKPETVTHFSEIPFIPISFFKTHSVISFKGKHEGVFTSSGTTGTNTSSHYVKNLRLYEKSFLTGFQKFFDNPSEYVVLGLLPSYLERKGSSLIYMVNKLIELSGKKESGFYLYEYEKLQKLLTGLHGKKQKTILFGVSYALLDMAENFPVYFPELVIMETGGMKGRRKEMIREELHGILTKSFGVKKIFSEYGMTELLSQAYSKGDGLFETPPWMKVLVRDTEDPFSYLPPNKTGGINVIDLANIYSCSFIETQDLGKLHPDGKFEVLGRFDNSDIRGCNLMVV